jgi:hypothetical protein
MRVLIKNVHLVCKQTVYGKVKKIMVWTILKYRAEGSIIPRPTHTPQKKRRTTVMGAKGY